jgi:hypothetical protein
MVMSELHENNEQAPVLLTFGDHAARMATLLRVRPSLLERVAYAPRRAIHAIGAFLFLAPEAREPDATVAAILDERDPRDLLRSAIPNAPARLYRALDRAGDRVHENSWYERLAVLCTGPLADVLLSGGPLNDCRFSQFEALLELDPAILSLHTILDGPLYQIKAVGTLITFLRAHEAFAVGDFRMPAGARLPAVIRRLQTALDRIEAPAPGFSLSSPFRVIRTVGELRRVGKRLKNCVRGSPAGGSDHYFELTAGTSVYVTSDHPPLLATVQQVGPGLWKLDELNGPQNTRVDTSTKSMLMDALQAAGVRILQDSPADALSVLSSVARIRECEDDPDDEPVIDVWLVA